MNGELEPMGPLYGPEIDPLDRLVILRNENQQLLSDNMRLHELAVTDELTGLKNRHGLREWAEEHYDPSRSYAMLVIDFADFGALNNAHGQDIGDEALRAFGEIFPQVLRTDEQAHSERRTAQTVDAAAVRLGGDEFIGLIDLDHLDPAQFDNIMLRITARLSAAYVLACRDRLPEVPRMRMDTLMNQPGESFTDFFKRGNSEITVMKLMQKAAEARTQILELS